MHTRRSAEKVSRTAGDDKCSERLVEARHDGDVGFNQANVVDRRVRDEVFVRDNPTDSCLVAAVRSRRDFSVSIFNIQIGDDAVVVTSRSR